MNEQIKQIASRIRELRDILDITPEDASRKIGVPLEEYLQFENAKSEIPISVLYNIAAVLGVDPTELMGGDEPKMDQYAISRRDNDIRVQRTPTYSFHALAFNFKGRDMDPMIVELLHTETTELTTHPGQEFNYVLEGEVEVSIGAKKFVLGVGDSFYFNPGTPHGHRAVSKKARFLTVINERNKTREA